MERYALESMAAVAIQAAARGFSARCRARRDRRALLAACPEAAHATVVQPQGAVTALNGGANWILVEASPQYIGHDSFSIEGYRAGGGRHEDLVSPTITCNGALTKALFMLNTTALTSVTGELLDPLQYSCKLNAVSAQNLSSVDTWTFAYASAPKDVTTPAGAPLPLLVSQVDTDPFQNCLGRGHIQAKIAQFWGAAAVETVDFVEMGHVHAEGWDAKVVPPLAAWLDKA